MRQHTAKTMATSDIGALDLSDSDDDSLLASPSKPQPRTHATKDQRTGESRYDAEEARNAALQRELEGVRSINEVIEGVVSSLERAKGNMEVGTFTCRTINGVALTYFRPWLEQSLLHPRF